MEDFCPLCMEELDATDKATLYCECNYQVCNFCWQQLHDNAAKENSVARCPNCRTEYDRSKVRMLEIAPEELESMRKRKSERKMRPPGAIMPLGHIRSKRDLANIRVLQKNLVYAVGLPPEICDEELLKSAQYFGQFGKILKLSVTRPPIQAGAIKTGSGSAYITYKRTVDAERCIKMVDDIVWLGRHVRACYGTTKYCNAFLKNLPCNNSDCLYLHAEADDDVSFTKEEMAHIGPAKFAGHTGLPQAGFVKQAVVGGLVRDMSDDAMPDIVLQQVTVSARVPSTAVAVPGRQDTAGTGWDPAGAPLGGLGLSPPSRPSGSWASTLAGAPGAPVGPLGALQQAPPAVDSEADFPELSSTVGAPGEGLGLRTASSGNGLSMAEIARAASGQSGQTAASRLKARDGKKMQSLSSPSKVGRVGMAAGMTASASSLSELDPGSRPESRQQNGSGEPLSECESPEGLTVHAANGRHGLVAHALDIDDTEAGDDEDEQSQMAGSRTASSAVWQLLDAGEDADSQAGSQAGSRPPPPGFEDGKVSSKKAPPPGFEHLVKSGSMDSSGTASASRTASSVGHWARLPAVAQQFTLEAILQATEVILPTCGRIAAQSRFAFARNAGVAVQNWAEQSSSRWSGGAGAKGSGGGQGAPLGMELLRQLQTGAAAGTPQQAGGPPPGFGGDFQGFPSPPSTGPSPKFPPNHSQYGQQQRAQAQWHNG